MHGDNSVKFIRVLISSDLRNHTVIIVNNNNNNNNNNNAWRL
jgi:hypothetical protein